MTAKMDQLLTVDELSEVLQIPVRTLYFWRNKGTGPKPVPAGRYLRYRRETVEAWLLEQEQAPAKPKPAKIRRRSA